MYFAYLTIAFLFALGIYTLLMKKNLIRLVIGINIIESAIILLLMVIGFRPGGTAPILDQEYEVFVDPIPQALALTAIVIGASMTALMLALIIKIYKRYNTLDIRKIKHLWG